MLIVRTRSRGYLTEPLDLESALLVSHIILEAVDVEKNDN